MNKSTPPSQLALKKGEHQPFALLTAKDDNREPEPPEAAQSGVIAGATIRLGVISEQLRVLTESLDAISLKTSPICAKHPDARRGDADNAKTEIVYCPPGTAKDGTPYHGLWFCGLCVAALEFDASSAICDIGREFDALKCALSLTTSLMTDLQRELGDATESKENANGQPISR